MSETTCAVADCPTTRLEARGWCAKHYVRWRRFGTVELQGRKNPNPKLPARPCSVEGCTRAGMHTATGWCKAHAERAKRLGDPGAAEFQARTQYAADAQCSIDGCSTAPASRGWCAKHYARFRAHGDPMKVTVRERTGVRTCAKCGRGPDEVAFTRDRNTPDGFGAYCKPCAKEYGAVYYLANRDVVNAANNARYHANRARYLASQKAYRLANIDAVRAKDRLRSRGNPRAIERSRLWRLANRERFLAGIRDWYQANKEYARERSRQWALANPDRAREIAASASARRSARKRNPDGRIEYINRRRIWKRDRGICGLCAMPVPFRDMHLDHIVPLSKGGPHTAANVHATHSSCNLIKGSREVAKWGFARIVVPEPRRAEGEELLLLF